MIDRVGSGKSIRRKCSVLGVRRQTYYSRKAGNMPEQEDVRIAETLHGTVKRFTAWGFWMVFHYLRKQGLGWNHKKVYRVWKRESLHLRPVPKRKKIKREYLGLLAPGKVNEGWSMDFLSDWVVGRDQKKVRIINVMDDCSRKALWTEAHESISATKLIDILDKIVAWRGLPSYIRCDNGPEFISEKLAEWAKGRVEIRFIQPGKPSQNGLIERLNGTLRRECLDLEWFGSLEELNENIQGWWATYNTVRPHSSIGYLTPDEFEGQNEKFYSKAVAA
jgi:putative transposase